MRIDKFLANSGIGTRTEVKDILKSRKVRVNDKIVINGSVHVDEKNDLIKVGDEVISYKKYVYIMLNKPQGIISATEDKFHKTVIDLLGNEYRTFNLFPVGRLDIDTEGLLILTNDGNLAHNLLSPKKHVDKTYYVEVKNSIKKEDILLVEKGIEISGNYITKSGKLVVDKNDTKKGYITISEGKFHQVKKMFHKLQNEVIYLKRVSMGNLNLDNNLKLGEYRELTEEEIKILGVK